jgi:hypothetical protein
VGVQSSSSPTKTTTSFEAVLPANQRAGALAAREVPFHCLTPDASYVSYCAPSRAFSMARFAAPSGVSSPEPQVPTMTFPFTVAPSTVPPVK